MGLLDGKVALITGAGGGLGRAHALALAAEGARIVVNDLGGTRDGAGSGTAMADQVVAEIVAAGGEAVPNYDSVATVEGGERMVAAAVDAFGRLDIVVNNAGILRDKTLTKMSEAMWDSVIAVHLKGAFCVTKPAVVQMRAQGEGGKIINTSSYAGLKGNIGQANYGAAKAGIAGFTRVLGIELSRYGIEVNAIAPVAKTRMTVDIDMVPESITPDQIAPFVVFLASSLSKGVTGRIFGLHGDDLLEYKQVMTPPATKRQAKDGVWTAEEIAARFEEFTAEPSFAAPAAAEASGEAMTEADKVRALFHAMPKAFKAKKAGAWATVMHFEITGTGAFTLTVKDGECTVVDGAEGTAEATVTFASAATILGLANGSVNPQQAFMSGQIKASNLAAMMSFGQFFDMRRAQKAVDAVMGGGSTDEGPSSDQLVDMIFERMPEGFLPDKAASWNALIHFEVGGVGGYTLAIEQGTCRSMKGKEGTPGCTITFADADTILGMVSGDERPEQAFMQGRIKTDNMAELMKFGQAFDLKRGAEEAKKLRAKRGGGSDKAAGLNRDCLGRTYSSKAVFARPNEMKAYAEATDDRNARYLDDTRDGGIVAPPLFAVKPLMDVVGLCVSDGDLNADLLRLVHGEQEMHFHRPIRPWDLVNPRAEVYAIEDKRSGQLLKCRQKLWVDGELATEVVSGYFIRGKVKRQNGHGTSKPASEPEAPRDYLFKETGTVSADQPTRYGHASGDTNPIHMDPRVAEAAGHPSVILHGLCTMAFAQRAVVDNYLGGDPTRLKRLKVRFSRTVLPGDVLTTRAWLIEQNAERTLLGLETLNGDGEKVLSQAEAEVVD